MQRSIARLHREVIHHISQESRRTQTPNSNLSKAFNRNDTPKNHDREAGGFDLRGMRKLDFTLSSKSSRVAFSLGKSPLYGGIVSASHELLLREITGWRNTPREAISSFHPRSIFRGLAQSAYTQTMEMHHTPPVGSSSAGKTSVPQIDQAATAVTIPAKPVHKDVCQRKFALNQQNSRCHYQGKDSAIH